MRRSGQPSQVSRRQTAVAVALAIASGPVSESKASRLRIRLTSRHPNLSGTHGVLHDELNTNWAVMFGYPALNNTEAVPVSWPFQRR
jgi:hypothetical protein